MRTVWIFSFECAGVVKVGGLGEAVYNIATHLANRGLEVTVFMPSHGASKKPEIKEKLALQRSDISLAGSARGKSFLPYKGPFRYHIGIQAGVLSGFKVVLFHGLNDATAEILDSETVYRSNLIEDKSLMLARGISGYVEHLRDLNKDPPDVVHAHDYHAVPAAIAAKQKLEEYNHKAALVFTIHLLSDKKCSWNYLGEDWCGIKNRSHQVYYYNKNVEMADKTVLRKAGFKLESFCAIESDVLTSVSQSYLQEEVIRRIGRGCEGKTAFHWNGCDWNYRKMLEQAMNEFGEDIRSTLKLTQIGRHDLRKYFLTKAVGNLRPEEPILEDERVKETVSIFKDKPFIGNGRVEPFNEDGPMVLMTGRLGEQKGADILFKAIPYVLKKVPKTKFVLLLLPLEEEIKLINQSAKLMSKYPLALRIVFGRAPSIYSLAHLASDVFVCPSKWEPFGIMALEAMATGNPVVATAVGGLKEIVVDVNQDLQNGTGILVPRNDYKSLGEALSSLLATMQISEISQTALDTEHQQAQEISMAISSDPLKKAVLKEPSYGIRLRENAIRRVETTFRWSKTIQMVIDAYEKAINLATAFEQS
jgi:starch synthase